MPVVAAMVIGPAAQRLAGEQIGALATTHFCETIDALAQLAAGGGLDAVVADLRDALRGQHLSCARRASAAVGHTSAGPVLRAHAGGAQGNP